MATVTALNVHADQKTTHRRVPARPQLQCIGGSACNSDTPPVRSMRCVRMGSAGGTDYQWSCEEHDLDPRHYQLTRITVTCEGFDHETDPFILRGSCAVDYTLDHTTAFYVRSITTPLLIMLFAITLVYADPSAAGRRMSDGYHHTTVRCTTVRQRGCRGSGGTCNR